MTKRILAVMALLVALALPLSVAGAQEEVTIRWWHINTNENEAAFWQQVADDYMAANPGVTIEITILENEAFKSRLVTVMQAGDPPDLFQSWGGGVLWQFADAGLVRDISPELEGEWKDSFSAQAALELYGLDGAYYGVPWNWGAVGFFYNKALFEQAGIDAPPATWDELLEDIEALKAAGITPIALGEQDKWPGHFWWVYLALRLGGGDAFLSAYSREGSFADEPFVQAGEYLAELVAAEPFQDGYLAMTYGQQSGLMGDGLAAMELMGQWAPGSQVGNSQNGGIGDDLGWFPFPVVEGGLGNADDVLGGGDGFAVGVNAPDATVDFLKYITSLEVQTAAAEMWVVPTVIGAEVALEGNEVMETIVEVRNGAPYSQLYYDQFLPPAV
ncbi:MAG: extracellular solute-binding protein, partial [Anaerolineae bacterium]|nr:extracellular solute-binding protein [Anaerolineae bacterium]